MKYKIQLGREHYHRHSEMVEWCCHNIGAGGHTSDPNPAWDLAIFFGNSTYYFAREQDATAFALKWT